MKRGLGKDKDGSRNVKRLSQKKAEQGGAHGSSGLCKRLRSSKT